MCGGADSIEELFVVDNKDLVRVKAETRRPVRAMDPGRFHLC